MTDFTREEVSAHFDRWRAATDRRDLDEMQLMLTDDAIGGNCVSGTFKGAQNIIAWSRRAWPEIVPNRSIWHVIDGSRVVNKWFEELPGVPANGVRYTYEGISEFIYAGEGKWNYMYGIPDVFNFNKVYERWMKDGNSEKYGDIFSHDK